jgi:hypothetical protein
MGLLGDKFEYVAYLIIDEWDLNSEEIASIMGLSRKTAFDRDYLEQRFDLINDLQETLYLVYGDSNADQVTWLRTPLETLGNQSPIQSISDGKNKSLIDLARGMKGP